MSEPVAASYVLPSALITRADLARLVREIEALDNELEAQKARAHATGHDGYQMPVISRGLRDFSDLNKLDLTNDQARMQLKDQLKFAKDKAPVIHMTFAVEADPESLAQVAEYIRRELHPQALLQVGLQPSLVGGVYMRTPNHIHDFSLRARLAESRAVIAQDIDQLVRAIPVAGMSSEVSITTGEVPVAMEPAEAAAVEPAEKAATPTAATEGRS